MRIVLFMLLFPFTVLAQDFTREQIHTWQTQAKNITIIRDSWGVPHIYGKTDADVTFGLMYAQCEDNYWQMEETTIRSLGRASEIYGEKELDRDANVALFECVKKAKKMYDTAGPFFKTLCDAATGGINFYLYKHPSAEKRLLQKYEPWFFLVQEPLNPRSHGITQDEIRNAINLSTNKKPPEGTDEWLQQKESGSNTIALAPSKTKSGKSMLLINPHVPFFGDGQRYEAHLASQQGLDVSGFAIFGTFYIWSGFNRNCGWAHTNTASDYEDVYLEHFNHPADSTLYQYGDGYKRSIVWRDTLWYKTATGLKNKIFNFRKTHHGPVVANRDSLLVTIKNAGNNPAAYILQAWAMCKAKSLEEFTNAMNDRQLGTNTMYADRYGNVAYWHGNIIPKRNENFNWRLPVDGSDTKTEWTDVHALSEIIHVLNPSSGWIQNCNSTPFLATGSGNPLKQNYPAYMAYDPQTFRSDEAIRLLSGTNKISFKDFEELATSDHLPMMEAWMPKIIQAYDRELILHPGLVKLKSVTDTLRKWNYRYSLTSTATSIAVLWNSLYVNWLRTTTRSTSLSPAINNSLDEKKLLASDSILVKLLEQAVNQLNEAYGTPFVNWGEINRLQRIHTSGVLEKFEDDKMSIPVNAAPGGMGSLFSFNTRSAPSQKKMYGVAGNSYVALVEFGKKIKARSVVYFGQSADPASPHYFDQAPLYTKGKFKDVYFYKKDVEKHAERKYHPGE